MKRVLSLLLAFTFLQVQTWALSGGPFSGSNSVSIIGTYSGTLVGTIPKSVQPPTNTVTTTNTTQTLPNPPVTTITSSTTQNSSSQSATPSGAGLGIFSLAIPPNGIGTGVFALFVGGVVYIGKSAGLADPAKGEINGIFTGQFTQTNSATTTNNVIFGGASSSSTVQTTLGAQFKAKVESGGGGQTTGGSRISGTANVTTRVPPSGNNAAVFANFVLMLKGFRQSTDSSTPTTNLSDLTLGGTSS